MGVMLIAAGSLRWFRDAFAPGRRTTSSSRRPSAGEPGAEGAALPPVPLGRADAARRPGRARRVHRALAPPRPRRARPRRARGRRLRPARLARAPARARRRAPRSARVSGGGARSRLWLEIVASVLGLPLELTAVEEGAAFGAALLGGVAAGVFADVARGGRRPASGRASGSSRTPAGRARTRPVTLASARCTRPSSPWRSDDAHWKERSRSSPARAAASARAVAQSARGGGVSLGPRVAQRRRPRARRRGRRSRATSANRPTRSRRIVAQTRSSAFGRLDILRRQRRGRRVRPVPRAPARAPRGDDRREPQGNDLRDRARRSRTCSRAGRPTSSRSRPRRAAAACRCEAVYCASKFGAGRLHARARPRAARARRPLHERLPGRRRDRLRPGARAHARDAGARRDDERRRTWPRSSSSP